MPLGLARVAHHQVNGVTLVVDAIFVFRICGATTTGTGKGYRPWYTRKPSRTFLENQLGPRETNLDLLF